MSKYRVTKKEMKERYGKALIDIGNGTLQSMLTYCPPQAYSTRAEGWACDYYEIDGICLCDGYDPVGKKLFTYDEREAFEKAARNILDREWEYEKRKPLLDNLIADFVGTAKTKLKM